MQASQQLSSTGSISSRLLKLSLCPHPAAPNQENQVLTESGRKGESLISSVESFSHTSRAQTGTATTEESTLVQAVVLWLNLSTKPKNRSFPLRFRKAPNCYWNCWKENKPSNGTKKTRIRLQGQGPGIINQFIKSKKKLLFMPKPTTLFFGQLCCQSKQKAILSNSKKKKE